MSEVDKDQKTELPSQKRIEEAQEKGQFAKSTEIGAVCGLFAALGVLTFTLESSSQRMTRYAGGLFSRVAEVGRDPSHAISEIGEAGKTAATILSPVLCAVMIAAVIAGGVQSGFRLSPKAIGFKPERLDPIAGFGRVFSKKTLTNAGLDLIKLFAISLMLWIAAKTLLVDPLFSTPLELPYLGDFIGRASTALLGRLILVLAVVAALSYAFEWKRNFEELKMTRQEVKDERHQAEGDAMIKAAMRRMARRLLQRQMLEAVATADVVVTNPTHYAVALKYESGKDSAPIVLAKGENRFALRIKELAAKHDVPMVENRPVARMLYSVGKVGHEIPPQLFAAVAEILAFVYRRHRYYFYRLRERRAAQALTGAES